MQKCLVTFETRWGQRADSMLKRYARRCTNDTYTEAVLYCTVLKYPKLGDSICCSYLLINFCLFLECTFLILFQPCWPQPCMRSEWSSQWPMVLNQSHTLYGHGTALQHHRHSIARRACCSQTAELCHSCHNAISMKSLQAWRCWYWWWDQLLPTIGVIETLASLNRVIESVKEDCYYIHHYEPLTPLMSQYIL